ncbi:doublecortin domain-containing protein 1 [Myotis lucifugus]|uniref:doublecortin domain-containing protein 1 n=1 Tax=Myotis lucifugus TaxID=59463 RepID=UPI000CCC95B5|nr:doublecortin domain-containing protein 1 [Myotis lucifugus]
MAKIETEDHRTALSQSSSSSLTKAMKESQQSNSEGTFNGDNFHSVDKYSSNYLPREFMTSQAKAVIKTTKDYLQPQFGPNRLLLSAAISEGSGLQNCSTHQTVSDHRHGEISYPDSYKSNRNNNSCFISASKRNRPVSAPEGQPRVVEFSSLKFQSAQNWHRISQRHKLQPRVIRVTAYKNGSRTVFAKVAVQTISLLLEECTEKLHLNMAARRVFLADGSEALEPEDIPHEADVYVSMGEPFLDPFKKIKDHLLLMKKVTWTMNGLMFPTKVKRRKTKPVLSTRMKKLTGKTSIRILFFRNGMGQDGHEVIVGKETMKKVLDTCTMRMNLNSPARYLFDLYGRKIKDISKVSARWFLDAWFEREFLQLLLSGLLLWVSSLGTSEVELGLHQLYHVPYFQLNRKIITTSEPHPAHSEQQSSVSNVAIPSKMMFPKSCIWHDPDPWHY